MVRYKAVASQYNGCVAVILFIQGVTIRYPIQLAVNSHQLSVFWEIGSRGMGKRGRTLDCDE